MFHGTFEELLGLTLWFFMVAILPEVLIAMLLLRPVLARRMRKDNVKAAKDGEYDEVFKRVVAPVRAEIAELKAEMASGDVPDLSQEFEDFEARFTAAYTTDMLAIQETIKEETNAIPLRVSGLINAPAGVEEKAFRKMIREAEGDVDSEIGLMEAVASQNPEMTQIAIAQKIQRLGQDEAWQKEHPIGSIIMEIGKPQLMNWVQEMTRQMSGAPARALEGPARKRFTSPYGP